MKVTVAQHGSSRRVIGRVALGLWLVVMLVAGSSLMSSHLLTLPLPDDRDAVAAAIGASRSDVDRDRWLAVHILYEACGCSARVLDELQDRHPSDDAVERIVLVAPEPNVALAARFEGGGYVLEQLTPKELEARYGIVSAPMLIVVDDENDIRYLGGYTDRKRGPDIKDLDILAALAKGERVSELPLFGCATSRELQAALDPLGLKY